MILKATEACRCCSLLDKQHAFFESKNLSVYYCKNINALAHSTTIYMYNIFKIYMVSIKYKWQKWTLATLLPRIHVFRRWIITSFRITTVVWVFSFWMRFFDFRLSPFGLWFFTNLLVGIPCVLKVCFRCFEQKLFSFSGYRRTNIEMKHQDWEDFAIRFELQIQNWISYICESVFRVGIIDGPGFWNQVFATIIQFEKIFVQLAFNSLRKATCKTRLLKTRSITNKYV